MRRFLQTVLLLAALVLPWAASAQVQVTVGDGSYAGYYAPFNNNYRYSTSECLYLASEINQAGQIDTLWYDCSDGASLTFSTMNVYMATTSGSSLSSNWLEMGNLTLVYSGTSVAMPTEAGWFPIVLDNPYYYGSTENLLIVVTKTATTYSSTLKFLNTPVSGGARYRQSDSDISCANISSTVAGLSTAYRPNIKLSMNTSVAVPCTRPTALAVDNVTSTGASISWTPGASESSWKVVLSNGQGAVDSAVVSTPAYTCTSLAANTPYSVAVKSVCAADDISSPSTVSFRTACGEMVLPYTNNFDGEITGSSSATNNDFVFCWSRTWHNPGSSVSHYPYVNGTNGTNSSKCLYFYQGSSIGTNYSEAELAVMPQVNTTSYPISGLRLTANYKGSALSAVMYVGVMSDPDDYATFEPVDTINFAATSTWGEHTTYFSNYIGEGSYIAFACPNVGSYYSVFLDDLTLEEAPSCLEPSAPVMTSATTTSATLAWTAMGSETQWQIRYKATSDTGWTLVTANANPFTLTGLNAATLYEAAVKAVCSASDESEWGASATFATECEAITTFPWSENFDGYAAATAAPWFQGLCWTNTHVSGSGDKLFGIYVSAQSGNATPKLYLPDQTAGTITRLLLPAMDFTAANAYRFTLSVCRNASGSSYTAEGIRIYATPDGTIDNAVEMAFISRNITVANTSIPAESASGWYTYELPIPIAAGYIMIQGENQYGSSTYMDNFVVDEMPSCLVPSVPAMTSATTTSATLAWTAMGSETQWQIRYKATSDTGWTLVTANANPFTLTGLNAATLYEAAVKAVCSASDESEWGTSATFATECEAITTFPWSENFDGYAAATAAPWFQGLCWTNTHVSGSGDKLFGIYVSAQSGNATPKLYLPDQTAGTITRLLLPAMDFTAANAYRFTLSVCRNTSGASFPTEGVRIYATPDGTIDNAVEMAFISRNSTVANGVIPAESAMGWYTYELAIPIAAGHIMIQGESQYGNSTYMDNFVVDEMPSCVRPTNVTAEVLSASTAQVSWTPNEGQTNFVVAYGTVNDVDSMSTMAVSDTTVMLTGLAAESDYYVYVQSVCDASTSSEWSNVATFYTGYCQPSPSSVDGQGITNVTFGRAGELVNNSNRPTSAPFYGNYSIMVGSVAAGTTANVDITYATGYTYGTIIWVDWNNNLTFESDEVVYAGQSSNANPTTLNASFSVPATVDTGVYRMRIAGADSYFDNYTSSIAAAATANPCFTSTYAVAHDYSLRVEEAPSCMPVTEVSAVAASMTTAHVNWTPNEGQTNFVVAYGTVNDLDSMTTMAASGATVMLTGLAAETNYYVYVQAVCDATTSSDWSNVATFYTGYCQPTSSCVDGQGITNVTFGRAGELVNNSNSPTSAPFYGNYSNMIGAVAMGTTANVDITYSTRFTYGTVIWVDWNNNLTFEGDEVVYAGVSSNTDPTTLNASFSVPATVDTGVYRMRIAGADSYFDNYTSSIAAAAAANPCFTASYAMAHDYSLRVIDLPSYTVTVLSNDTTMGVVTGSGVYLEGETDTITAVAAAHHHFVSWSDGDTNATRMITVASNITLTATFAIDSFQVLAVANDTLMGTVAGAGSYAYGSTATLTAVAAAHHHFLSWNDGDTNATRTVVVNANASYTATFAIDTHTVALTATVDDYDMEMGYVTGSGSYAYGSTATIEAEPEIGFRFLRWSDGDTNATRTLTVTSDTALVAIFDYDFIYITMVNADTAMGTITPAPGLYTLTYEDELLATAYPRTGYHFTHWVADLGFGFTTTSTNNPEFLAFDEGYAGLQMTLTAHFAIDTFNVLAQSIDTNMGAVTGSGLYTYGSTATLIAVPAEHYHFTMWSDGDTNAIRTIVVTSDTVLVANFALEGYTVAATANDTVMGAVTGSGIYAYGDTATLTAVAAQHYHFTMWNDGVATATRTVIVTGDTAFVANFAIDTHTVAVAANNAAMGTVTGAGNYAYGTTATIAAVAAANAHFVQWNDGDTNATRVITVAGDTAFTANFAYNPVTVTLINADTTMGYTTPAAGVYTFEVGDTMRAQAVANEGFRFLNWVVAMGNMQDTLTVNPIEEVVTADFAGLNLTVTVNFEEYVAVTYEVVVNVVTVVTEGTEDTTLVGGTVTGAGTYEEGEEATLVATPAEGCVFEGWLNESGEVVSTDSVYTFIVEGNVTLTARFSFTTGPVGIETAEVENVVVYGLNSRIIVRGAENQMVRVYDVMGRMVAQRTAAAEEESISVRQMGVYLVQVGRNAAVRVMVR